MSASGAGTAGWRLRCAAICDDFDRLKVHAPAQRISVPGDKKCSKYVTERLGHLELCGQHAKMAREGLLDANGRVASRADINNVRKYPKQFPGGLYHWLKEI